MGMCGSSKGEIYPSWKSLAVVLLTLVALLSGAALATAGVSGLASQYYVGQTVTVTVTERIGSGSDQLSTDPQFADCRIAYYPHKTSLQDSAVQIEIGPRARGETVNRQISFPVTQSMLGTGTFEARFFCTGGTGGTTSYHYWYGDWSTPKSWTGLDSSVCGTPTINVRDVDPYPIDPNWWSFWVDVTNRQCSGNIRPWYDIWIDGTHTNFMQYGNTIVPQETFSIIEWRSPDLAEGAHTVQVCLHSSWGGDCDSEQFTVGDAASLLTVDSWSLSPATPSLLPGESFTFRYTITNPNPDPVRVTLGATLKHEDGTALNDDPRDLDVDIASGTGTYQRNFVISDTAPAGRYNAAIGLHRAHLAGMIYFSGYTTDFPVTVSAPPPPPPEPIAPTIAAWELDPASPVLVPGDSFIVRYKVNNPNPDSLQVLLGATLRHEGGSTANDDLNEVVVTTLPGEAWYWRNFTISANAEIGKYNIALGLHKPDKSLMLDFTGYTTGFPVAIQEPLCRIICEEQGNGEYKCSTDCDVIENTGPEGGLFLAGIAGRVYGAIFEVIPLPQNIGEKFSIFMKSGVGPVSVPNNALGVPSGTQAWNHYNVWREVGKEKVFNTHVIKHGDKYFGVMSNNIREITIKLNSLSALDAVEAYTAAEMSLSNSQYNRFLKAASAKLLQWGWAKRGTFAVSGIFKLLGIALGGGLIGNLIFEAVDAMPVVGSSCIDTEGYAFSHPEECKVPDFPGTSSLTCEQRNYVGDGLYRIRTNSKIVASNGVVVELLIPSVPTFLISDPYGKAQTASLYCNFLNSNCSLGLQEFGLVLESHWFATASDNSESCEISDLHVSSTPLTPLQLPSDANATALLENNTVKLYDNGNLVAELQYIPEQAINLSSVTIEKQPGSAARGYLRITGLELAGGATKTVYVDHISGDRVCIKDAETASIEEISSGCTGAGEISAACNSIAVGGYTCTLEGTRYKVTGLKHSAVIEYSEPAPAPPPASSSGSSGGGGGWSGSTSTFAAKPAEEKTSASPELENASATEVTEQPEESKITANILGDIAQLLNPWDGTAPARIAIFLSIAAVFSGIWIEVKSQKRR